VEDNKVIYSMYKVSKVFSGNKQVLKDISLGYYYGAKIGVIGLNGSGKSTLLRIMAGIEKDYLGEVTQAKGYTIGYLEQDPQLDPERTVRQIVEEGVQPVVDMLKEYENINMRFAEEMSDEEMNSLLEKQGNLQDMLDANNAWDLDSRLDLAMDSLRCPPSESLCGVISGGEKRRVALCRLLLQEPDILLLDEPTNHLDAETIHWLEKHLQEYKGTVIAITHDRYFLDHVANWILELDRGYGIPWKGNYESWLDQKTQKLSEEEKKESDRQRSLREELKWIRNTPKANHAINKARIAQYEQMLDQDYQKRNETREIYLPAGPKLGQIVIQATDLAKSFKETVLFENLSFEIPPGAIVGVIGPNGAGKTTLFNLITEAITADAGTIRIGETAKIAYVNQNRELDPEATILDIVAGGREWIKLGEKEINSRAYISRFNFSSEDHKKKIRQLSGGEKNRVFLALVLQEGANVLLLDEPTNDLDVTTIRALEEALQSFAGSAIVISHDRYFLDRICTHILAFEGESQVRWFDGNFSEFEEDKLARLGEKALRPHRITYRKLTRA